MSRAARSRAFADYDGVSATATALTAQLSEPLLVVRADASPGIGAGHAMRCLTLAEQWLEMGGRLKWWGNLDIPFARRRADALGIPIAAEAPEEGSLLLVDTYDLRERLRLAIGTGPARRVLVDDLGGDVPAGYDGVWNPNAYGHSGLYPNYAGEIIAGEEFVPIRRGLPRWTPMGGSAVSGALSFGGGDLPPHLHAAVSQLPAVLALPHGLSVGSFAPPGWQKADPDDPWSSLRHAAWLITAAGTTLLESAVVGIPVLVVVFADNHALAGEWARQKGSPVVDARNRSDPSELARELASKLSSVRPLPALRPGSDAVARRLWSLMA